MFSRRWNWSQYNTQGVVNMPFILSGVSLIIYPKSTMCICPCSVNSDLQVEVDSSLTLVCVCTVCVCTRVRRQARNGCYMLWERWAEGDSPQLGLSDPGTLQAVSPRIAERKWNTLYPWSPAGQLWQGCPSITEYQHLSSPPLSLFLSFSFFPLLSSSCSLQYVCVCSARSVQRRKIERRVGAGWQVPTIGCLEIP